MPLFECTVCHCVENTALSNAWARRTANLPALCSECDPGTKRWHGIFEKRSAVGMLVDSRGFLWSQELADRNQIPPGVTIVGKVAEPKPEPLHPLAILDDESPYARPTSQPARFPDDDTDAYEALDK